MVTRLGYILVFGLRYRRTGQTGHPVRAGSVDKALLASGTGHHPTWVSLTPGKKLLMAPEHYHPVLRVLTSRVSETRKTQHPAVPTHVNTTIIQHLDCRPRHGPTPVHGQSSTPHVIDLIIVAFFWLLRPAEYVDTDTPEARTQAFRYCDVTFHFDDRIVAAPDCSLNDLRDVHAITAATLTFNDQKNAVRGKKIGHAATSDPFYCPCKSLARICLRLHLADAPALAPIHRHFNPHPTKRCWYHVKAQHVTNALRHAANHVQQLTGISSDWISARSLRPGGATALLCTRVDSDAIRLLGRWKSDAMLRYLRIQAATITHRYAQNMWDHGAYRFAPGDRADIHPPADLPQDLREGLQALWDDDEDSTS